MSICNSKYSNGYVYKFLEIFNNFDITLQNYLLDFLIFYFCSVHPKYYEMILYRSPLSERSFGIRYSGLSEFYGIQVTRFLKGFIYKSHFISCEIICLNFISVHIWVHIPVIRKSLTKSRQTWPSSSMGWKLMWRKPGFLKYLQLVRQNCAILCVLIVELVGSTSRTGLWLGAHLWDKDEMVSRI